MADFLPFIKRFRIREKKYLPKSLQIQKKAVPLHT